MTLSALKRLRALPPIALALALAVALAGCSSSEPAEEPAAPTTAEEPATSETPAPEEAEEPEPAAPAVDKSQLVATITTYYSEDMGAGEQATETITYDDEGRLLTYGNAGGELSWTYDDQGRILTEKNLSLDETGGEILTTYTYAADGSLAETLVEDATPALYLNQETGEMGEDPALGELWQEAGESYRIQWTYTDDGKQAKGEYYSLEGELTETKVYYYDEDARSAYDVVSVDPQSLGQTISPAKPIRVETFDAAGAKTGETTYTYDADGNRTSQKTEEDGKVTYESTSTYDKEGNRTSFASSYPEYSQSESSQTAWTYDEAGRPTESASTREGMPGAQIDLFTYDSKGRLKARTSLVTMMGMDEEGNPVEAEPMIDCSVYDYLEGNEELSVTPEQLMEEIKSKAQAA